MTTWPTSAQKTSTPSQWHHNYCHERLPFPPSALREGNFKNCGLLNSHIFLLFGIQEQQTLQPTMQNTPFPSSLFSTPESPNNPRKSLVLLPNYPQLHSQHQLTQFPPFSLMLRLMDLPSLSCRKLPMHPPETCARLAFLLSLLQLPQSPQDSSTA